MDDQISRYRTTIKLVTNTISYIFTKNGVLPEDRTAQAVADLTKTLLDKFDYAAIIFNSDVEDVTEL